MKYEDFDLVANPSGQGYIQKDATQKYIEEALTTLYPEDSHIPVGAGFDSNGPLTRQYIGRVKFDITITDVAGTPTIDGDYFKAKDIYDLAVLADTNEYLYDLTDPENALVKVIAYEDAIYGNQLFISVTKGIVAFYDKAQTGDNLAKIITKLGLEGV